MSLLENIKGLDRKKPICLDPKRNKFILIDDIIDQREKIFSLDKLNRSESKKLVIERLRKGPDFIVGDLNGLKKNRHQVIEDIKNDTKFGKMTLDAELSYLKDLLREIEKEI